jgi:anti-sigma factor RsiW
MSTSPPSAPPASEPHPEFEALLSDLEEGTLSADEVARVRAHLAGCEPCAAAHAELSRTLSALSSLHKHAAPPTLPADVADTIHRRSGGRFFGRRAFGDRIPFELLALLALAIGVAIYLLLRSSATGSLRLDDPTSTPPAPPGAHDAVPRP